MHLLRVCVYKTFVFVLTEKGEGRGRSEFMFKFWSLHSTFLEILSPFVCHNALQANKTGTARDHPAIIFYLPVVALALQTYIIKSGFL